MAYLSERNVRARARRWAQVKGMTPEDALKCIVANAVDVLRTRVVRWRERPCWVCPVLADGTSDC